MSSTTYKKRSGTSGIQGQLYETKLMSLIYFRLIQDERVEKFSLATNRDDIGAFDDIAFKAKIKGFDKPVAVFIQAKHRENDRPLTFNKQTDLTKYFDSYLEIRRAFEPNSKDMIFGGNFDETECFFVMYTTAKDDPKNTTHKKYEGDVADYLNKLIGTGGCCTRPTCKDEDLDFLCKIVMKEQITTLAEQLAKFICDESSSEISMNNNDVMLRYHVILALKVLNVSEVQPEGHRLASFRNDFFASDEEFLVLFKNILCLEVLKKRKSEDNDNHSSLLKFLNEPSDVIILSKLLGSILTYKKDKLEIVSKSITDEVKQQLDKADVPQPTVYEAAELAAKDYILSRTLKVPVLFGNIDLAIRGNDQKIKKRLDHLTTKIIYLLKQSQGDNIVTIDESLEDGFLRLNGGIASAVGNILVFDDTSKLLKFTGNCESLGKVAKSWYEILRSKIENLHKYKFDVKVKQFPKLSFEQREFDEDLVRDFYSKLLFYTSQAGQHRVENILKEEIKNHPLNDVKHIGDRSELIFLKYHDDIQKQWMAPREGSYLTKKSKIYQNAVTYALNESLMGVLKNMRNLKNQDYRFNEDAIKRFGEQEQIIGTIIVTESCVLTVAKVEQYLRNKDHTVLDLEYIFKLPLNSHRNLCKELMETSQEKIFIVVCNQVQDIRYSESKLKDVVKAVDGKDIIVVTDKDSVDIMAKYFSNASNVWNDEKNVLTDLTFESQKKFLATHEIKFQGDDISLDKIVDETFMRNINEEVFYKLFNNETVDIGSPVILNNYEKQLYIDRKVSRTKKQENDKHEDVKDKVLETFFDLKDDFVVITAGNGMGKSTLLTHLTLKTKERDPTVWIVRINLAEYERIFRTYLIVLEPLKSLEFMCQVALNDKSIEFILKAETEEPPDEIVYQRKHSGCNLKDFTVKLFLHYYKREKLIFVIDGYDEINPEYEIVARQWLKTIKNQRRKFKIWVTASPTSKLEEFGPSYKMDNFSHFDQAAYLKKLWKYKIQFKNLYTEDIQNVEDFVDYMHRDREKSQYIRAYVLFLEFLKEESLCAGIDFPYDDHYNHFMRRFGFCESTIPWIPDNIKPKNLNELAKDFDVNNVGKSRMFYEISRGNYADF